MPEGESKKNDPLTPGLPADATDSNTFPPAAPGVDKSRSHEPDPDHRPAKRHWVLWLVLIIMVLGGIYVYRQREAAAQATAAAASRAPRAIPITTATATKGDIGVYVDAPATVTPIYTVPITGRVQGEIIAINYHEGQMVHKGDPLIDIDPKPYQAQLTQTEGQLAHDQAVLSEARIDLTRYQAALTRNAIAKQQVDDQEQVVAQDEGTVKNDQGQVEAVKVNLAYCHITSPIDGRVGLRLVDLGNMVQGNSTTPLVVVTQLQPITVVFSVAQSYLPQIQQQMRQGHQMAVDAFDTVVSKKIASGHILTLDNEVDPTTETIKLKAIFENSDFALFPQQFVNARLQLDTLRGVTLIPAPAVQMNSQVGSFVYVMKPDQTVSIRNVTRGASDSNVVSVEGVNPGEIVATNGFNNLQDGAKVSVHSGGGNGSNAGTPSGSGNPPSSGGTPAKTARGASPTGSGNSSSGNHE